MATVVAAELVAKWSDEQHPGAAVCPGCGQDCSKAPLTEVVYTFEPCNCGSPAYSHLVAQLHHRLCFAVSKESGQPAKP